MRWKEPDIDTERKRSFFAWVPVRNYITGEIRWLEYVNVTERFNKNIGSKSWDVIKFHD